MYIRLRLHHNRTVFYRYFIQMYLRWRLQNKNESDRIKIPKKYKVIMRPLHLHFTLRLILWTFPRTSSGMLTCFMLCLQWHVNKTHTLQTIALKNMSLLILSCVVQMRLWLTQMWYVVFNSGRVNWLLRPLQYLKIKNKGYASIITTTFH
jgi:hypothetical protein